MKQLILSLTVVLILSSAAFSQNCQLRTQTMGGWGAPPKGNNPGKYLHTHFAAAFPAGLSIGCQSGYTLKLTSAQAVTSFLPSGGQPRALTSNLVNPGSGYNNTFAGQVAALALSVGFDAFDPNFGLSSTPLGSAIINSGTFTGMTVQQVLDEANKALGGCATTYSISALNSIVSSINESFVDGIAVNPALLSCPVGCPSISLTLNKEDDLCGLCTGSAQAAVSGGQAPYTFIWSNGETTDALNGLCAGAYTLTVTDANGCSASGSLQIAGNPELQISVFHTNVTVCPDHNSICQNFDISGLGHGTLVNNYFAGIGATISILPGGPQSTHNAVIYDTDGSWTEDPDLNLGVGNVIIIDEKKNNNDGDGLGPDDSQNGGCLIFTFASPVTVTSFLFLDSEEDGGVATAYDSAGNVIASAPILNLGNASVQTVMMHAQNTSKLEICYPKSGAVRLNLDCPVDTICNGTAAVVASGGVAPYTITWSNGSGSDMLTGLCPGIYEFTVTDMHGCQKTDMVHIGIDSCASKRELAANLFTPEQVSPGFIMLAYPNPFERYATVTFQTETTGKVRADIVTAEGRIVVSLFEGVAEASKAYRFNLNGKDMPAGLYFYRIVTDNGQAHYRKLMLIK